MGQHYNKPDVVESTCRCLRKTRRTPDGRGLCSINPLRYNLWSQFKLLAKPNSPHRLFGRPVQSWENKLRGAELRGITGPIYLNVSVTNCCTSSRCQHKSTYPSGHSLSTNQSWRRLFQKQLKYIDN